MKIDPIIQNMVLKLSELALIKANGADAMTFLNNQFTNDINDLGHKDWQFNGYCTAQGRLIAIMRLFRIDDDIYLIVPKSIAQSLVKRLQIYIFRAKVNFEIINQNVYAYLGTTSKYINGQKPGSKQFIATDSDIIINLSGQQPRYLEFSRSRIQQSDDIVSGASADYYWRLSEINESIPTVFASSLEKFIPQHINLDQIGGVNFTKGCFPGQEVVARLHYLGKSKQSMQRISLMSDNKLTPGDSILHPQTQKPLTIVDAVETQDQSYQCLVVGQFK